MYSSRKTKEKVSKYVNFCLEPRLLPRSRGAGLGPEDSGFLLTSWSSHFALRIRQPQVSCLDCRGLAPGTPSVTHISEPHLLRAVRVGRNWPELLSSLHVTRALRTMCGADSGGSRMINFKHSGMVTLQRRSEKASASVNSFKFSMETLPENTSLCEANGRNSWMQDTVALIPLSEERQRAHSSKWSGHVPGTLGGMEFECICMWVKLLPHHPIASKLLWWWFW